MFNQNNYQTTALTHLGVQVTKDFYFIFFNKYNFYFYFVFKHKIIISDYCCAKPRQKIIIRRRE